MANVLAKSGTVMSAEETDISSVGKKVRPKLPTEIQLGAHTLKVIKQKGLSVQAEACGIFDPDALTITIDTELPDSLAWETFWHEVVEAINHFSEAAMEHKSIQVFGLLLHQVVNSIQD
jgi:hypothetical protein